MEGEAEEEEAVAAARTEVDEERVELKFVFGDATMPVVPKTGPVIIVHVVDNTGA